MVDVLAYKSVRQYFIPNQEQIELMNTFKDMVNHCIKIGLENNVTTLRRFSKLYYHKLEQYDIASSYKLNAISQACGRLAQMKKDNIRVLTELRDKNSLIEEYEKALGIKKP